MDYSPPGSSVRGARILQAKNTGVGSHSLLQGIFLTQELNWGLLNYRPILYHLSHQGSPFSLENLLKKFSQCTLYNSQSNNVGSMLAFS